MKNVLKSPAFDTGHKKRVGYSEGNSALNTEDELLYPEKTVEQQEARANYPSSELELALLKIQSLEQENQQLQHRVDDMLAQVDQLVDEKAQKLSRDIINTEKQSLQAKLANSAEKIEIIESQLEAVLRQQEAGFEAEVLALAYEVICEIFSKNAIDKEDLEKYVKNILNKNYGKNAIAALGSTERGDPGDTFKYKLSLVLPESVYSEVSGLEDVLGISLEYSRHIVNGCLIKKDGRILDYRIDSVMSRLRESLMNSFEKHYGGSF